MYRHNNSSSSSSSPYCHPSSDFLGHLPPPLTIVEDGFGVNELESVAHMMTTNTSNYYYSNSSSSSASGSGYSTSSSSFVGSPSSPTSYFSTQSDLGRRSLSSHSLLGNESRLNNIQTFSPTTAAGPLLLQDTDIDGPVRRVFSTGDLHQGINNLPQYQRAESPLPNENSVIIEGMTKACRYSPEEKRERIERYRSKRSQRNFNKKIQYACRKTLADTRPRIKGRFARNDEQLIENPSLQDQWTNYHMGMEEDEEDEETWINLLDSFSNSNNFQLFN